MKVLFPSSPRQRQGAVTILVLAFLSIVLIYLSINAHSISNLQRELRTLEREQIKRLQAKQMALTNTMVSRASY
jgi:hypothetical protein